MYRTGNRSRGAIILLTIVMAAPLGAQEQRQPGRGGFRSRGLLTSLAIAPTVQAELKVADDMKQQLLELSEEANNEQGEQMRALFAGGIQDLSDDERLKISEKMAETTRSLNTKYRPKLKALLKDDQYARLQQIGWQAAGSMALAESDLGQQLQLTPEQQSRLAGIHRDFLRQQVALVSSALGGGNFEEFRTKSRDLMQQRDKAAEEVLTPEQRAKYGDLKGQPFDLTTLPQGGFGGRRRDN
ncbi:MAG: hypothetical protein AB7O38_27015 [Pirellulaceae bacterium]